MRVLLPRSSTVSMQDVVTRGGKLLYLYKRPGKRVIVNDSGHMMVGPSMLEFTLQQNTAGVPLCSRVTACITHSLQDALWAGCTVQMDSKPLFFLFAAFVQGI